MFDLIALDTLKKRAKLEGVDWRVLASIAEVESGGRSSTTINGVEFPLIRFEGHYFWRLLDGVDRKRAVTEGLAARSAGKIKNPRNQAHRYKMLHKAKMIDPAAAIQSCSWGIGQVMGSHWKALGFASPEEFERIACSGAAGQIDIMLRFIEKNNLFEKIRNNDLDGFFRIYNGPQFRKWGYPEMYQRAWRKWGKEPLYEAMPLDETEILPLEPEPVDLPEDAIEELLREDGSRTIQQADEVSNSTVWSRIWAAISGSSLAPVLYFLDSLPVWVKATVVVAIICMAFIFWLEWRQAVSARNIRAARVDDAKTGKNLSRLEGLRNVVVSNLKPKRMRAGANDG